MRASFAAAAVLLIALSGFASSSSDAPKIDIRLAQTSMPVDTFYFRGPVSLQYQLTIANPTSQQVTLRRLDLSTVGPGAYSLRTGATPITRTIRPNGTTTITLSTWGRASGGDLRSEEPVTVRGIAYFDTPNGRGFVRQFIETFNP
ncbi:MAG TPA: hypothetical protein VNN08_13380 [Thermoanaerobaculia bacterium]|nr:hypothetical protein [Thermoanaerobaculia bacterium]